MSVEDLYTTLETRNWYALVAFAIWALIALWKKQAPGLYYKVPEGWRWLLPLTLASATGFVDGYVSGLPWKESALRSLWALLTMGLGAMGVHGALKDAPGAYGGGKGGGAGETLKADPIEPEPVVEESK